MIEGLKTGDVIELRPGLRCYHNHLEMMTTISEPTQVVVETTRHVVPISITGVDAHFENCFMVKARQLLPDGAYDPHMPLFTFAQYGDFREEFILPGDTVVIRRMRRSFV